MYNIKVVSDQAHSGAFKLQTEKRNLARVALLLFRENKMPCEVTEEVKPRSVKFKGVD